MEKDFNDLNRDEQQIRLLLTIIKELAAIRLSLYFAVVMLASILGKLWFYS